MARESVRGGPKTTIMLRQARALARAYDAQLHRTPLRVKMATSGMIVSGADVTAQLLTRKDRKDGKYDPWRTLLIGVGYGALWFAPCLHVITARMWPALLPSRKPAALLFKTAVDLSTSFPLNVCVITGLSSLAREEEEAPLESIRRNLWPTLKVGWAFWGPVNMAMYGVVPMHYRVLFLNTFSYVWNTYLIWRYE